MYKNEKNNSPSIPQRVLVEQKSGTAVAVSTPSWLSLAKKAGKSHFSLSIVEQVYCRGLLSSKYNPKNTPEQQAFNRVDSFLHEGKAYELDQDLLMEIPKVPDGRKHMSIIKSAIKHHEERNKPQQTDDSQQVNEGIAGTIVKRALGIRRTRGGGLLSLLRGSGRKTKAPEDSDAYVERKKQRYRDDDRAKSEYKQEKADAEKLKSEPPEPQPQPQPKQSIGSKIRSLVSKSPKNNNNNNTPGLSRMDQKLDKDEERQKRWDREAPAERAQATQSKLQIKIDRAGSVGGGKSSIRGHDVAKHASHDYKNEPKWEPTHHTPDPEEMDKYNSLSKNYYAAKKEKDKKGAGAYLKKYKEFEFKGKSNAPHLDPRNQDSEKKKKRGSALQNKISKLGLKETKYSPDDLIAIHNNIAKRKGVPPIEYGSHGKKMTPATIRDLGDKLEIINRYKEIRKKD